MKIILYLPVNTGKPKFVPFLVFVTRREDSSLHRIFESQFFRFPLSTKNSLTRGAVKCEKLNLRKTEQISYRRQSLGSPE